MRLLITVLVISCAACASRPAAESAATEPAPANPYASQITSAGNTEDDVICRFEYKENSRMRERVCATRAERTQHAEKSRARIKQR